MCEVNAGVFSLETATETTRTESLSCREANAPAVPYSG
jgi:hypothetical protein